MGAPGVIVIGGGQAGLATSHELTAAGVEHVVLERGRVGETWRGRWDSFCLVTPNWSVRLPGGAYEGDDPDGYLPRDEIVAFLERYAAGFQAPVRSGVDVVSVEPGGDRGFALRTSDGELRATTVVIATGTYGRPHRPPGADTLPPDVLQLDVEGYRNPDELPAGEVLVIGSGQTGCQLAEEFHEAGREVVLSCGRAPWLPRSFGGRDMVWWALEVGFLDHTVDDLPSPDARLWANVLGTGHGGGHDLNLRTLRAAGITLVGHFRGADGRQARFADDLAESVAWGDDRYRQFRELVRATAMERGLAMPDLPDPEPFDAAAPTQIDLSGFGAVVFAGGFRPDYARWIRVADAFDELGFPIQTDGASGVAPGLFFVGTHFLRTRKSSLLSGVGDDAAIVASAIAASH